MAGTESSRMAAKKRTVISISSSPSSSEEESSFDSEYFNISSESESESEENDVSSNDDVVEEITSSSSRDYYEDDNDCVDEENEGNEEESLCRRVVNLLQGKCDLEGLTLMECKAYLRKHGLRLSGTRGECILRIKEHRRLKDGTGETLYPRSSFNINCTGDVCRGDVVLFTQKVYKKSGRILGKRTVAGRVVKESYGAAKQQHTFTVEVLWSKGTKRLLPLFPLLVKGRNLYRMKTYRQPWKNENERAKILDEKHRRGAAARLIRDMRRTKSVKRTREISSTKQGTKERGCFPPHAGSKRQKRFLQHPSSPQTSKALKKDKHGKTPVMNQKRNGYHQKLPAFGGSNLNGPRKLCSPSYHHQHQNFLHPYEDEELVNYDYHPHYGRPSHEWGNFNHLSGLRADRATQSFSYRTDPSRQLANYGYNPHYARPSHEWVNFNHLSGLRADRATQSFSYRTDTSRQLANDGYHPRYGRPSHEWGNSNHLSGLITDRPIQPFSYRTDS